MSALSVFVACLEALFGLLLVICILASIDEWMNARRRGLCWLQLEDEELEPAEWLQNDLIAQTMSATRGTEASE